MDQGCGTACPGADLRWCAVQSRAAVTWQREDERHQRFGQRGRTDRGHTGAGMPHHPRPVKRPVRGTARPDDHPREHGRRQHVVGARPQDHGV